MNCALHVKETDVKEKGNRVMHCTALANHNRRTEKREERRENHEGTHTHTHTFKKIIIRAWCQISFPLSLLVCGWWGGWRNRTIKCDREYETLSPSHRRSPPWSRETSSSGETEKKNFFLIWQPLFACSHDEQKTKRILSILRLCCWLFYQKKTRRRWSEELSKGEKEVGREGRRERDVESCSALLKKRKAAS